MATTTDGIDNLGITKENKAAEALRPSRMWVNDQRVEFWENGLGIRGLKFGITGYCFYCFGLGFSIVVLIL